MNENLTLSDLEKRWDDVLTATQTAVFKNPGVYRKLKSLAVQTAEKPLDINDYLATAKKLLELLKILDDNARRTIFFFFNERIQPACIWQVSLLRVECRDLLAYLEEFDAWRLESHGLRII